MTFREQSEVAIQEMRDYLAGCKQSPVDPNLILMDRRDIEDRVDRLEKLMMQIAGQCEAMEENRGEMERAARRESEKIIRQAEGRADDVYAASIIYTDNMIGVLQNIIDDTNDSLNGVIRRFRKEMRRQKDQLRKNEAELQAELIGMKDSKKFLQMIEEVNEEREAARRREENPEEEEARQKAQQEQHVERTAFAAGEKPDIVINKDAAYFKWAEMQSGKTISSDGDGDTDTAQGIGDGAGQAAQNLSAAPISAGAGAVATVNQAGGETITAADTEGAAAFGAANAVAGEVTDTERYAPAGETAGAEDAIAPGVTDAERNAAAGGTAGAEDAAASGAANAAAGEAASSESTADNIGVMQEITPEDSGTPGFVGVEKGLSWPVERKEDGAVDLQHTKIIRPVSRQQIHLEREEARQLRAVQEAEIAGQTAKMPKEGAILDAMLQGEMQLERQKDEVLDDADQYTYYDDPDGLDVLDDLDDYDDYDDFEFGDGQDAASRGKQVAGKIKDFLLGK